MKNNKRSILITLVAIGTLAIALSGCITITGGGLTGWGWKGVWDAAYNGSTDIPVDKFTLLNKSETSISIFKISIGDTEPTSWTTITTNELSFPIITDATYDWHVATEWPATSGYDTIWFRAESFLGTKTMTGAFVFEDSYGWRLTVED